MDPQDIAFVVNHSEPRNILGSSCSDHLGFVLREKKSFLQGRGIIELGSAATGIIPYVFDVGVEFYVGVDPGYAHETRRAIDAFVREHPQCANRLSAVADDGLTFLQRQPSDSANVVSSGVLDTFVIGFYAIGDKRVKAYQHALCEEIFRVTPPGGISCHYGADRKPWQEALVSAGFRTDEKRESFLFYKD